PRVLREYAGYHGGSARAQCIGKVLLVFYKNQIAIRSGTDAGDSTHLDPLVAKYARSNRLRHVLHQHGLCFIRLFWERKVPSNTSRAHRSDWWSRLGILWSMSDMGMFRQLSARIKSPPATIAPCLSSVQNSFI